MKKAYFFDMDGVLFDSMKGHARAWVETMAANGLRFTENDAYLNEGRTGRSVIAEAAQMAGRVLSDEEVLSIYHEKSELFHSYGDPLPIPGVKELLRWITEQPDTQIYVVTGSGQRGLLERLEHEFPGVFRTDRMVTAYDVTHGKPHPEPYLKALEKARASYALSHPGMTLSDSDCVVVENAPLGVRAAKAAGLETYAVNTGPLDRSVLVAEGADRVFDSMFELLDFLYA